MKRPVRLITFLTLALTLVLGGCVHTASPAATPTPTPVPPQSTATESPTSVPPTNTPLPTATSTIPPTEAPTLVLPTMTLVISPIPTDEPEYACDFWIDKPADDTHFRAGADFDIRWTIINTGTEQWTGGATLSYQEGPKLTTVTKVTLPDLKPGEQYQVLFDATAPGKSGRYVMLWAVTIPNKAGTANIWMCYPYTRIIVK